MAEGLDGLLALGSARSYAAAEAKRNGAIKGNPGKNGKDGEDGLGIKKTEINASNHLIVTYDDDTTEDAGELPSGGAIDDAEASDSTTYSSEKVETLLGNKVFVGTKKSGTVIEDIFIHTNGVPYSSTNWQIFVFPVSEGQAINIRGLVYAYTKAQVSKYRWAFYDTMVTSENYSSIMASEHVVSMAPCDGGRDNGEDCPILRWEEYLTVPTNAVCCVVSSSKATATEVSAYDSIAYDYADKSCISVMNATGITSTVLIQFDALGVTKNTIFDIVSKYSGTTAPRVVGKTSLVTDKAYPISDVGFYKRNTLRYPYELKGERNTITITVPSGTTLDIKEMSVRFTDEKFEAYGMEMKCHNGVWRMCPENTAPAFEWAGKLGYKRLITQLHVTSDGEVVCIHDDSINATARNMDGSTISETINVADHTYAELLQYDYGIAKNAYWAKTKLPTFDEYLDICCAYGMAPEISMHVGDMGADAWAKVKASLKKRHLLDKITFKAFTNTVLQYAWDIFGDTICGYGFDVYQNGSVSTAISNLESVIGQDYSGKKFIELEKNDVNATNVNAILNAGYECSAWNTNPWEITDYINAFDLGVSAVTDDYNWQNGMLWH